jgi:hypothetical protein
MDNLDAIRSISRLAGGLYYLSALADRVNRHPNPTALDWAKGIESIAGEIAAEIKRFNDNATAPPTPTALDAAAPHPEGDQSR